MQPNTTTLHWKVAALKKAEVITDAWEVAKAYAGRAAEWVLFLCMIANIITMLPGMVIRTCITNLVLGVQVVMLDIGGMSLSSMAAHSRERGETEAARKASITSLFLIGLMILTLLLVSIGVLFPALKPYTDMGEKGLILVRVVMTVIYGHVLHSLRSTGNPLPVPTTPQVTVPTEAELEVRIRTMLAPVLEQYRTGITSEMAAQMQQALAGFAASGDKEIPSSAVGVKDEHKPAPASLAPVRRMEEGYASRDARLSATYQALMQEGIRPTGDTLSKRARCNRAVALNWLKEQKAAG